MSDLEVVLEDGPGLAGLARRLVTSQLEGWDREDLVDDAVLAVSELVTNATLHGGLPIRLRLRPRGEGVRLEVADASPLPPQVLRTGLEDVTGRGMAVVEAVSARWGWARCNGGKVIWCDLPAWLAADEWPDGHEASDGRAGGADSPAGGDASPGEPGLRVCVPDVPVAVFRDHMLHSEAQVRELHLIGAGSPSPELARLRERTRRVLSVRGYRARMRAQVLAAAQAGHERMDLAIDVPVSAPDSGAEFLAVLDEIDAYCRAERLLSLESPPLQRCFRRWLDEEISGQVRRARGSDARAPRRFEAALAEEVERISHGRSLMSLVLEAAPDAMVAVDRTGVIRLVNERTETLFGYQRRELVGRPVDVLIPQVYRESHAVHWQRYMESPVARPMGAGLELSGLRRDGHEFPVAVSLSAIEAETGLLVIAAIRDLSTLRAIRQSLRETHEIAEILQRSLLDAVPGHLNGLDVAARYQPAGSGAMVGGDWHDVFALPDGSVGLTVGDVSGHGIQAAATMGRIRTALAAIASVEPSPAQVLERVNDLVCRMPVNPLASGLGVEPAADVCTDDLYATALYGRLHPRTHRFTYAVAGHPPPIVVDSHAGTARAATPEPDLPLGLAPDTTYTDHHLRLPEAGRLVAFTDGLHERRDSSLTTSLEMLTATAGELGSRSVESLANSLLQALPPVAPELSDDLALIVIGW